MYYSLFYTLLALYYSPIYTFFALYYGPFYTFWDLFAHFLKRKAIITHVLKMRSDYVARFLKMQSVHVVCF